MRKLLFQFCIYNYVCFYIVTLSGAYSAVFFFVATVGGGIAARLLKICLPDVWIALLSGVLSFAGSLYTAFVSTTVMMFLGMTLFTKLNAQS